MGQTRRTNRIRTGKLTHAARRPSRSSHGGDLGCDERHMMWDMAGDAFQQGFEREGTGFGMHTRSLEVLNVRISQDDCHLTPHDRDQFQFVLDMAFLVV